MYLFQACFSIFVLLGPIIVMGQTDSEKRKLCNDFKMYMVNQQLDGEQNCTKMLNYTTARERSEKLDCVLKCILYREHVIDEQGFIDKDKVEKRAQEIVPPFTRERVLFLVHECMDHYAHHLDPNDVMCKSYDGISKCIQHVLMKQLCPPSNVIVPSYHELPENAQ